MISTMVTAALIFVAVIQFFKIYMTLQKYEAATSLIRDSNKFTGIKKNLEKMQKLLGEVLNLRNPNERSGRQIMAKMSAMNTLNSSTVGKISNLRGRISGYRQYLCLQEDYLMADCVLNFAIAVFQIYQFWHTLTDLTWCAVLISFTFMGIAIAALMFLTLVKFRGFQVILKDLQDIENDSREVIRLQEELQDLVEKAGMAYEKMAD